MPMILITDALTGESVLTDSTMSQADILIALNKADYELECAYSVDTINIAAAEMKRLIAMLLPSNRRDDYRFEQ